MSKTSPHSKYRNGHVFKNSAVRTSLQDKCNKDKCRKGKSLGQSPGQSPGQVPRTSAGKKTKCEAFSRFLEWEKDKSPNLGGAVFTPPNISTYQQKGEKRISYKNGRKFEGVSTFFHVDPTAKRKKRKDKKKGISNSTFLSIFQLSFLYYFFSLSKSPRVQEPKSPRVQELQ